MEKRQNAGYDIIKNIVLPNEEFVLGIKTIDGTTVSFSFLQATE